MSYTREEIKKALRCSPAQFLRQDQYLIEVDVHEQALCAALAWYLRGHFPSYNVDVEYNRKVVNGESEVKNPGGVRGGRIDLLVHRRGTGGPENNLLALEAKKAGHDFDRDEKRKKRRQRVVTETQCLIPLHTSCWGHSLPSPATEGAERLLGTRMARSAVKSSCSRSEAPRLHPRFPDFRFPIPHSRFPRQPWTYPSY